MIAGASAGTATLTVSTIAPTTGALAYPERPRVRGYFAGGATLAGVLLFGVATRRRRLRATLGLLVFLGILAGTVMGCGGKGSNSEGAGTTGTAGTTLGNYTVTVTATSGATTASTSVTVTVN